jgi:hypothetical protein
MKQGMITIQPAGNYVQAVGNTFGHVEIELAGSGFVVSVVDASSLLMTEFGLLVQQPGSAPNQFIPWGSISRIIEAPLHPEPAEISNPDDGQHHD